MWALGMSNAEAEDLAKAQTESGAEGGEQALALRERVVHLADARRPAVRPSSRTGSRLDVLGEVLRDTDAVHGSDL